MKSVPRYRVLVAEDEAITALALEQTLAAHGFDVCGLTSTGAEARSVAERARPAVAIIDVRLKDGVIGHVVARDLQARLGIPVILMSGHADARTARELGAAGFLPKPFSDRDLVRAIEKALGVGVVAPSES